MKDMFVIKIRKNNDIQYVYKYLQLAGCTKSNRSCNIWTDIYAESQKFISKTTACKILSNIEHQGIIIKGQYCVSKNHV